MESSENLAQLKPGQRAVIHRILESGAAMLRLQEMGLLPGTEVEVVRFAPMGDPLEIRVRGYMLSLRKAEAACVAVTTAT